MHVPHTKPTGRCTCQRRGSRAGFVHCRLCSARLASGRALELRPGHVSPLVVSPHVARSGFNFRPLICNRKSPGCCSPFVIPNFQFPSQPAVSRCRVGSCRVVPSRPGPSRAVWPRLVSSGLVWSRSVSPGSRRLCRDREQCRAEQSRERERAEQSRPHHSTAATADRVPDAKRWPVHMQGQARK